jgi:hypothetical protein
LFSRQKEAAAGRTHGQHTNKRFRHKSFAGVMDESGKADYTDKVWRRAFNTHDGECR